MNQDQLEARLRARLLADRRHPSRLRDGGDGTIIVTPSGAAVGLAIAISAITGEDDDAIMNRVMTGTADPAGERAVLEAAVKKTVTRGPEYTLYVYDEDEFKRLLGIGDPRPVLTVERDLENRKTIVRLSP